MIHYTLIEFANMYLTLDKAVDNDRQAAKCIQNANFWHKHFYAFINNSTKFDMLSLPVMLEAATDLH